MKREGIISDKGLATLFWELARLLEKTSPAGALKIMADEGDPEYRDVLTDMSAKAGRGAPLSAVMDETGRFPAYACDLVRVGESSKSPVDALDMLAKYYESRVRMDRRVRSALLYPAVMMLLMVVVIGVLLVRVLPIFNDVYASLGGRLTGVAGGLLALGQGLDKAMPVLLVVLAVVVVFFIAFAARASFRARLTAAWRKTQGDRGLARKMNDARVARALAMGMTGKSLTDAVQGAAKLVEDIPQAKARCESCLSMLRDRKELSAALQESGMLPASSCYLLKVANRGASQAEAIRNIADSLEEESESALEDAVSRVEPALVLVCSLLVGVILLSVMLPLMHIMSAIG